MSCERDYEGAMCPLEQGFMLEVPAAAKCSLCGWLLLPCVTQLLGEQSPGTEKQRHLLAAVLCCLLTKRGKYLTYFSFGKNNGKNVTSCTDLTFSYIYRNKQCV